MGDADLLVIECPYCDADILEGTTHDCPVAGTEISIDRVRWEDSE